jgi:hypothetical protein
VFDDASLLATDGANQPVAGEEVTLRLQSAATILSANIGLKFAHPRATEIHANLARYCRNLIPSAKFAFDREWLRRHLCARSHSLSLHSLLYRYPPSARVPIATAVGAQITAPATAE